MLSPNPPKRGLSARLRAYGQVFSILYQSVIIRGADRPLRVTKFERQTARAGSQGKSKVSETNAKFLLTFDVVPKITRRVIWHGFAGSRSAVSQRGLAARSRSAVSQRGLAAQSRSAVSQRGLAAQSRSAVSQRGLAEPVQSRFRRLETRGPYIVGQSVYCRAHTRGKDP